MSSIALSRRSSIDDEGGEQEDRGAEAGDDHGLPQPSALPRISPKISRNSAAEKVTSPAQSIGCGSVALTLTSLVSVITIAASPIGTLTKKIHSQPSPSVMTPPTSGPIATAPPTVAPQIPTRPGALAALELLGDQRQRGGEHRRRADALQAAGEVEDRRVAGEPAEERRDREDAEADREDAPAAEPVAERPEDEQERGEGQRVGVDDPLQAREARVEVALDLRQRDVDDRHVDQQHERRDADGEQRPLLTAHLSSTPCTVETDSQSN